MGAHLFYMHTYNSVYNACNRIYTSSKVQDIAEYQVHPALLQSALQPMPVDTAAAQVIH